MKKADSLVLKVFLYGLPLAIILAVFASFINPNTVSQQPWPISTLYNFAGLIFGLWMLFSLYLSMRLIFSESFRETILSKLTLIKERDEREALFTGKATKNVLLSSLAILICALCLSVFTVSIHKLPPEKAIQGKTGTISLGIGFSLWDDSKTKFTNSEEHSPNLMNFDYQGIPISKSGLILLMILWQIGAYNLSMRRLLNTTQEKL
jgi:hypothetical protein